MPPRREPRPSVDPSFPDFSQLGDAIAHAIQSTLRPSHRTPLESAHNLRLPRFEGDEGHEGAERWFLQIERTFRVLHSQGNLAAGTWVETATWFIGKEPATWWEQLAERMPPEEAKDWRCSDRYSTSDLS